MHLLHLPKLGYTMENGSITGWLVEEGRAFDVGAALYEVETEKNVVQVEARLPGTLAKVVVEDDYSIGVGTLVAVVADPGEEFDDAAVQAAILAEHPDAIGDSSADDADAAAAADPTTQLAAPVEGPAALAASPAGRVRALPKVRAAAERLGVDLTTIEGTGPRGALTVADVERAASSAGPGSDGEGPAIAERERRRLTGVKKAMAAGVAASWTEVPQFVQQFRVDVTAVMALRERLKATGEGVGLTAVLAAAIAHAVQVVPEVNAAFRADEVVLYRDVNVGVAVRSDRGLVVPTVAGVETFALADLDRRIRGVVDDARSGSLPAEAPTITLSNLGGYGVETGMPLVSRGQSAIVFTGDIVATPVVEDGAVVIRPLLGVAVGYDHRVIDGATGGEFCRALRAALEQPGVLEQAASES